MLDRDPTLRYIGWVLSHRGAYRDRHGRGNGMRWTRQRRARNGIAGRFPRERWTGARTNGVEMPRAEPGGSHTVRRKVLAEVAAYGKAVWSWHPLLVSSWRRFCEPNRADKPSIRQRRWQDERRRGERGISRKAIAQGEPGVSGYLWSTVCSFLYTDCGCQGHPAFPAPSDFHGAQVSCTTRALRAAGSRHRVIRTPLQ
jgi:hypothetical protein